jgi:hypothetical protein
MLQLYASFGLELAESNEEYDHLVNGAEFLQNFLGKMRFDVPEPTRATKSLGFEWPEMPESKSLFRGSGPYKRLKGLREDTPSMSDENGDAEEDRDA